MELQIIQNKIYEIRGIRVMLDFDLANLYDVETRVLKQAVKRNINRFPEDFMFELTKNEWQERVCHKFQKLITPFFYFLFYFSFMLRFFLLRPADFFFLAVIQIKRQ